MTTTGTPATTTATTITGRLERWRWRRLELRVVAAHQREVVATLRGLGADGTPVVGVGLVAGRSGTVLSLRLPHHRVALAGAASEVCAGLRPTEGSEAPTLTLSDAGRYRRAWWVTLTVGGAPVTVLGTHLFLVPDPRRRSEEEGPDADPRQVLGDRTLRPPGAVLVDA
jgi:hypothetical protein